MTDDRTVIAEIPKNARETIVCYLDNYKGHDLCHLRIHFPDDDGQLQPTSKGVAVRVDKIEALITALQDARAECQRRSLIGGG